ncbi:MAG: RDD family protein [Bacteroidales bacterium]|nr:RDD family protein [Bacteroidales bacterium]
MAKKIQIVTSQNVTIEYKTATIFERFIAWVLDWLIIWACIGVVILLWLIIMPIVSNQQELAAVTYYVIMAPFFFLYNLCWEIFNNGKSPGKLAMSLRVLRLDGEKAGLYSFVLRWAFRIIDIYILVLLALMYYKDLAHIECWLYGVVGVISIATSKSGQRIGDYLADTTVVKIEKSNRLALSRVKELDALQKYEPVYPEVTQLSEEEVLLIKEVVMRYKKYPTKGHKEAMTVLIENLKQHLQVTPPKSNIDFLNTLIKDYVALTR